MVWWPAWLWLQASGSGPLVEGGGALRMARCKVSGSASAGLAVEAGARVELYDTTLTGCGSGDDIVPKVGSNTCMHGGLHAPCAGRHKAHMSGCSECLQCDACHVMMEALGMLSYCFHITAPAYIQ